MNELDRSSSVYNVNKLYYFDEEIILNWYAKRIIDKFPNNISVLDLGLGHGITANSFSKHFNDYTILEGSQEIINKYKDDFPGNSANIINTYFEKFNTDKLYDLIIMGFILEHVEAPLQILSYYKKFLKEDGIAILAVPNAEAMNRLLGHYADLLDDVTKLSEHDLELGHKRYYTVNTFRKDIEEAELKIKKIEGIYLKPFTTKQIISLNIDTKIINALCELGVKYPELSCGIMVECEL